MITKYSVFRSLFDYATQTVLISNKFLIESSYISVDIYHKLAAVFGGKYLGLHIMIITTH